MRILILCSGNSCRSQMAEGFLKSFDQTLEVYSAGTGPAARVHPMAVQVMQEAGIDISSQFPKPVDQFVDQAFDFVITVCDHARETCPVFTGKVKQKLHINFDDPDGATGSNEKILAVFRRVRNEIQYDFRRFYDKKVK